MVGVTEDGGQPETGGVADAAPISLRRLRPPRCRLVPRMWCTAMTLCMFSGCTITATREAPIVDRAPVRLTAAGPAAPTVSAPTPTASTAGTAVNPREARDGSYVVQRGDTLYSIALAFQQDWRDIARWNGVDLAQPVIRPGQALRVTPGNGEGGAPATPAATPVAPVVAADARPLSPANGAAGTSPAPATPAPAAPAMPAVQGAGGVGSGESSGGAATASTDSRKDTALAWVWPAAGKVIDRFDETRSKGIDIGGKEGDAVSAAGDGEVVYTGNGLRPYGNLVIIKHSDDYISAYAHNRAIVVTKGQSVKRGQRIADMGRTEAESPRLHFEIRRQGKPVDPLKFLPAR